jgi:hypothetical protein
LGLAGDPYLDCNSGLCEKLVKKIMRESVVIIVEVNILLMFLIIED